MEQRLKEEARRLVYPRISLIMIGPTGLAIAKIVMGAIYLRDCDIEKMIPIYLIVSGVLLLSFFGFTCFDMFYFCRSENCWEMLEKMSYSCCRFFTLCLLFILTHTAWLICGSIWVFPNYGKMTSNHVTCSHEVISNCIHGACNMKFITFAFAMVTIDWICFALVMILLLMCMKGWRKK
ncbi:hypothetical protein DPMN_190425 [Dreissena polymorpha]|uniref:Uncharacterized protein n=1 Tax=Dreissena polymorpha TaxID=45954 RepID=A0A9D4IBQ7_DREPO|nr:hypothetical protein DPMN_190425 [Dreissena polymorpha]